LAAAYGISVTVSSFSWLETGLCGNGLAASSSARHAGIFRLLYFLPWLDIAI
jgi:hypothetical protein